MNDKMTDTSYTYFTHKKQAKLFIINIIITLSKTVVSLNFEAHEEEINLDLKVYLAIFDLNK